MVPSSSLKVEEAELLRSQASVVIMGEVALIENKKMLCELHNIRTTKFDCSLVGLQEKI